MIFRPFHYFDAGCAAYVKQWNPLLAADREGFVGKLAGQPLVQAAGVDATLRFNQGRG